MRRVFHLGLVQLAALLWVVPVLALQDEPPEPPPVYVPSSYEIVDEMLKLAQVTKDDVVFDLGCGDGRIVIAAAKLGARGVGIDIDPVRIKESNENAAAAGVTDRVTFRNEDLFTSDVSSATVVTLYLLPVRIARLKTKLWRELKVGTRIVAHDFPFTDWEPEKKVTINNHTLYLWTVNEEVKKQLAQSQQNKN